MSALRQTVTHLPLQHLRAHPGNLRDDLGDLTELALSIREVGILQPVGVTQHHAEPDRYVLLYGHRRLAAAARAGLVIVPAIIHHQADASDQIVLALVENIHRRDLDPIERAEAFAALINQGLTQAEVAKRTGCLPSNVSRALVLLDLPQEEQDEIRAGQRSAHRAITEHRQTRQAAREAAGLPAMGTTVRRGDQDGYFSATHRLADVVRRQCTHRSRKKVGGIGCGPCWEAAIRDEETPPTIADPQQDVDEVAVERRLAGDTTVHLNKSERIVLVARARGRGWSFRDIELRAGLGKPERYITPAAKEAS